MSERRLSSILVIGLSFIVALALTALPMPIWALVWRPAWVALVLIYWCMAVPARAGVLLGGTMGILLDGLSGSLLGQHALGLSVVAYISHVTHRRVRMLPLWQQGAGVFALVFLYQLSVLWVNGIRGVEIVPVAYWASPLVSTILWPWVFVVLRDLRRKYRVA